MNKFGIVLPTIGRDSLLEAINSVIAQTYSNWNLIVSWDWDDAHRVLFMGGFLPDDCRIINLSQGNEKRSNDSGASARNYAMKYVPTDCDWICYLDDDDIWHGDRLWKFNQFIEDRKTWPDFKLFYSYADLYKLKHKSPRSSKKVLKRIGIVDNITCGGMCHTMDVFNKTKGWNPNNVEDHDLELYNEMRRYCGDDVLSSSTFDFIWRD